jgi:hypothetical protein
VIPDLPSPNLTPREEVLAKIIELLEQWQDEGDETGDELYWDERGEGSANYEK